MHLNTSEGSQVKIPTPPCEVPRNFKILPKQVQSFFYIKSNGRLRCVQNFRIKYLILLFFLFHNDASCSKFKVQNPRGTRKLKRYNKSEIHSLALKPWADVTRSPKQRCHGPRPRSPSYPRKMGFDTIGFLTHFSQMAFYRIRKNINLSQCERTVKRTLGEKSLVEDDMY